MGHLCESDRQLFTVDNIKAVPKSYETKVVILEVRTRFGSLAQRIYELWPKEPNTKNL